jgi:hypothetical protein
MQINKMNHLYQWMWWQKGECVVEVISVGHFPTTAMVKLPNDKFDKNYGEIDWSVKLEDTPKSVEKENEDGM